MLKEVKMKRDELINNIIKDNSYIALMTVEEVYMDTLSCDLRLADKVFSNSTIRGINIQTEEDEDKYVVMLPEVGSKVWANVYKGKAIVIKQLRPEYVLGKINNTEFEIIDNYIEIKIGNITIQCDGESEEALIDINGNQVKVNDGKVSVNADKIYLNCEDTETEAVVKGNTNKTQLDTIYDYLIQSFQLTSDISQALSTATIATMMGPQPFLPPALTTFISKTAEAMAEKVSAQTDKTFTPDTLSDVNFTG